MFCVLIVDDAVDVRKILARELLVINDDCMPKIFTAKNGAEAMEIFNAEPIDVVITDVRMPVMDGIKLCENIRKISETTIIVLITAFQDFDSVKDAVQYDISNLLCKPMNEDFMEQLHTIIYKAFKKKLALSENKLYSPEYNIKNEVINAIESSDDKLIDDIIESLARLYRETGSIQQLIEHCVPVLKGIYDYYAMNTTAMPYSNDDFKHDINEMYALGNEEAIIEFVTKLLKDTKKLSKAMMGEGEQKIYSIKQYIDNHYKEAMLYVGFLSQKFEISRSYMCVLFKKQYGVSINSYLNSLRIDGAKKLLAESSFSIGKISSLVGYSERRVFVNTFKKLCDIPPIDYRTRYKNSKEV